MWKSSSSCCSTYFIILLKSHHQITTLHTHARSRAPPACAHMLCRPEAQPCQSLPLEWGAKCLAAVPAHNTPAQWHFLSLLIHLHGHFSVSLLWFSTNHSHTHTLTQLHTVIHMSGKDSHIQRPYVCLHGDKNRPLKRPCPASADRCS